MSTYFEAVQQAAAIRDVIPMSSGHYKNRSIDPENAVDKTSSFETAHGANWHLCEKHNAAHPIVLFLDADLIRVTTQGREQDGCTCPNRLKRNMNQLKGTGDIDRERDEWVRQKLRLKKEPTGKHSTKVIEEEWDAWVSLWGSVHQLANRRRQQIGKKQTDEEATWTEEHANLLQRHYDDVLSRESLIHETKPIMYCTKHCGWGDALPIMHMNRYKDCGICMAPVEETDAMKQRHAEDQKRIFPSYEVNQYIQQQTEQQLYMRQGLKKRNLNDEQELVPEVEMTEELDEKQQPVETNNNNNNFYNYTDNNNYNSITNHMNLE